MNGDRSPAALPATLVHELSAEKSAAISSELANRPDIALAAVVHALALDALRIGYQGESCLRLKLSQPSMPTIPHPEASKSRTELDQLAERLGDHVPGAADALWAWCLARTRDELLDILAIIVATSVDTLRAKTDGPTLPRLVHGDALARALGIDMSGWFTPTAGNYFSRVSRAQILADIDA